jgi:tripartite-type tricarboxylate transporter receptor subunit TctC
MYAALPNLASAHERGLADFEAPTCFAVFLPRGASEPIIRKLDRAAFATADTPSVQERRNVSAGA